LSTVAPKGLKKCSALSKKNCHYKLFKKNKPLKICGTMSPCNYLQKSAAAMGFCPCQLNASLKKIKSLGEEICP